MLGVLLPLIALMGACEPRKQQQNSRISVEPASVAACDPAVEVLLLWDFTGIPGVKVVNVYVGASPNEKLFVAGGVKGSAKTGSWARPGTRFVAKEESGRVLSEVSIQGPSCS